MIDLGPYEILVCRGDGYEFEIKLSPEDHAWAEAQGNWFVTQDKSRDRYIGYAARKARKADHEKTMVWLHKRVLVRAFQLPPTPAHHIGDHMNGDHFDNRRGNLRWATHQMNSRNLFGFASRQMELGL